MKDYKIGNLYIFKGDFSNEHKYRSDLSNLILGSFGKSPYTNHDIVRNILTFSYNYYCKKFISICESETSVRFYQFILSQHENATQIAVFSENVNFPEGLTSEYIANYRRVLKWILEQAINVPLHNKENPDERFYNRSRVILNELVFIGSIIIYIANLYAEQDMIEDVAEIIFEDNLYVFKHKHHYDDIIDYIQRASGVYSFKHVVDNTAINDLKTALDNCFHVNYDYLRHTIAIIQEDNKDKGGMYCGFEWDALPLNMEAMFGVNVDKAKTIFRGLTLDRQNKLKLNDLACKPQTMIRYIYRPILIWHIEGKPFAVIGTNAFTEAIIQLATNNIPWGKAPEEWKNNVCFKDYIHSKEDEHDKWLDDEVENTITKRGLHYFRNLTNIKTKKGHVSLISKDVGEIDFIIINHHSKTIFIVDCKHLQGRYDMMSQRNDYSNFTKKNGYNQQISNKIAWVKKNIEELDFHNMHIYGQSAQSIVTYKIEGIFIINTPTFYMYNADYRIYTVNVFADVITGALVDPVIQVEVENNGIKSKLEISYPYFKKPNYELKDQLNTLDSI